MNQYVAVDLETTGLSPKRDKIIEIGAVRVREGQIIGEFRSFVNPHCCLSSFVKELTGIEEKDLKDAPELTEAIEEFLKFAQEDVLLGHHLIFDYSFLKHACVNMKQAFERDGIDTLKIARFFLPELESKSLETLCTYYQIKNSHAHRASHDAVAAAKLFEKMKAQFFTQGSKDKGVFLPQKLIYHVKRESPITQVQIRYLNALLKGHGLILEREIEFMTKNEASRTIDQILSQYGKLDRNHK